MNFIADDPDSLGIGDGRVVVVHGGWRVVFQDLGWALIHFRVAIPINVVRGPAQSLLLGQLGPNDRCGEEAQCNPPLHCSFVYLNLLSWVGNQVPLDTNHVGAVHRCP